MKKLIFKGAATALITPMTEEGKINFPVLEQLLELQIEGKADAVVIAGTTGEASTLSDEEHVMLVEKAVKQVGGRIPVIAGAGSNDTAHAVWMSKACEKAGADALQADSAASAKRRSAARKRQTDDSHPPRKSGRTVLRRCRCALPEAPPAGDRPQCRHAPISGRFCPGRPFPSAGADTAGSPLDLGPPWASPRSTTGQRYPGR